MLITWYNNREEYLPMTMSLIHKYALSGLLAASVLFAGISPSVAEIRREVRDAWGNKIVKQSVIGAGVGAGVGAVSGESSILRGAGIGALTGAGTGLVDSSRTLHDKPLVRSTAKGAIIGTGASAVTRRSAAKGAAVGAGAGVGAHFIRKWWND